MPSENSDVPDSELRDSELPEPTDATVDPGDSDLDREDVQDDVVIEAALRKSLMVFIFAMLPVIGILLYVILTREKEKSVETTVQGPTLRDIEETTLPTLVMTDVTDESGIDFTFESGRYGDKLLPETMGGGVAILDYNNDQKNDVLLVNAMRWPFASDRYDSESPPATCKLYRGDGDGHFQDVTTEAGLDITLYGMGVAVGDYDNDGDTDIYLSAVGANRLLRNEDGKFTDATSEAGVAGPDDSWSTSCGFFDYDNDGRLDLFVCSYVQWNQDIDLSLDVSIDGRTRSYGRPKLFSGTYCFLYHNEGDGKFADVSESAGIQIKNELTDVPMGKSMGVAPCDYNGDGWLDIIVANDTVRNFLFENNRDGTFSEKGELLGIAYDLASGNARGAMGIDTAVFRPDGSLAVGIGNFANEASALYMASPKRPTFVDAAMFTGFGPPTRQGLTFGLFFFDADLDGRPDVFGANGHLEEEIAKIQRTQRYAQRPQLFWNAGKQADSELVLLGEDCTGKSFCDPIVGRGACYGDLDSDGDDDVVVAVSDGKARVFRNDQSLGHHWLRVRLKGTKCNRDGIGTVVRLTAGGTTQTKVLMPTRSYLSQCEKVVTFGLGKETSVSKLEVQWPMQAGVDQSETIAPQVVSVSEVDQTIEVVQE